MPSNSFIIKMDVESRIKEIITNIHNLSKTCYPDYKFIINFLTIFSQSEVDYEELREEIKKLGRESVANNGFKYELFKNVEIEGENVNIIRIRRPDIHRREIGCADLVYRKEDYTALREIALENGYDVILRKGYEMIELSNFSINVYAYLVRDLV